MKRVLVSTLAIAALGGAANGQFFSIASDSDDMNWAVMGEGANMVDAAELATLLIDDNNGPLDPIALEVDFEADISLSWVKSSVFGDDFLHVYSAEGSFSFNDLDTGDPLIAVSFSGAVLAVPGSENAWSSTGALLGSDGFTEVTYESFISLPAYGVFPGLSVGPDDFGFDLTVINTSGELPYEPGFEGVELGEENLPASQWWSEASYSGSANFIPTPGALALLGLAGMFGLRRRR
jgi:MYXO-CTERM domain-containing protein